VAVILGAEFEVQASSFCIHVTCMLMGENGFFNVKRQNTSVKLTRFKSKIDLQKVIGERKVSYTTELKDFVISIIMLERIRVRMLVGSQTAGKEQSKCYRKHAVT
jgi:hypothetical protein